MKFCQKCGKQLLDEAVICPGCGCAVNNNPSVMPQGNTAQQETPGIATGALICSFLVPIVGLILGIVGACKYQTPSLKNKSIAAIAFSIGVWALSAVILSFLMYM